MKWLGSIGDPKDLTTKEYVDAADEVLKSSTEKAISELDNDKIDKSEISEYSKSEVNEMWMSAFKS